MPHEQNFHKIIEKFPAVMSFMPLYGNEFSYTLRVETLGVVWLFRNTYHALKGSRIYISSIFLVTGKKPIILNLRPTIRDFESEVIGDPIIIGIANSYSAYKKCDYLIFMSESGDEKDDNKRKRKIIVLKKPEFDIFEECRELVKITQKAISLMR